MIGWLAALVVLAALVGWQLWRLGRTSSSLAGLSDASLRTLLAHLDEQIADTRTRTEPARTVRLLRRRDQVTEEISLRWQADRVIQRMRHKRAGGE